MTYLNVGTSSIRLLNSRIQVIGQKKTRNWSLENEVWLNPEKNTKESTESSNVS